MAILVKKRNGCEVVAMADTRQEERHLVLQATWAKGVWCGVVWLPAGGIT